MKKLISAAAALTLLVGANAMATNKNQGQGGSGSSSSQQQGQMGSTGSSNQGGQYGQYGQQTGQLTGRILKASRDNVTIEYNGAAVPFDVTRQTQFQGVTSARDLQEGQQVRANFDLKNNKNELRSLSVISGSSTGSQQGTTGGSQGTMGGSQGSQGTMGGSQQGSQGTMGGGSQGGGTMGGGSQQQGNPSHQGGY